MHQYIARPRDQSPLILSMFFLFLRCTGYAISIQLSSIIMLALRSQDNGFFVIKYYYSEASEISMCAVEVVFHLVAWLDSIDLEDFNTIHKSFYKNFR